MSNPQILHTCEEVNSAVIGARMSGQSVGLVPTMGALHEGHLSLVKASREACDLTVVTIFVNPAQFGPTEDLEQYPRTLASDVEQLAELGVDFVFAPSNEEMYPPDFTTLVEPPRVAERLEGACRPEHFRGVATIVLKLFNMIPANVAFFGQKDYQQTLVIRRMVKDLNCPVEIRVCPIVREADGLALSSRNAYLDDECRTRALAISKGLSIANAVWDGGERDANVIRDRVTAVLQDAGIARIDYVSLADPETLAEVHQIDGETIVLIAAYVGEIRLIDNRRIG